MRSVITIVLTSLLASAVLAQQKPPASLPTQPAGDDVVGRWTHLQKTPDNDPNEARIKAANGFHVNVFARGLEHARMLLAIDDGTVLLSRPRQNDVLELRDTDGDGRADRIATVASALGMAHGLAMRGNTIYVAGETKVWTIERLPGGGWGEPRVIVSDLPTGGQHPNRTIGFGPDGLLYVSVGSTCNDCDESNPENATMLQMEPDGSNRRIYARGLRNTIGFDWHPQTNELWGLDHGSDWRGDNLPPDEVNRVVDGASYGWPLCFGKQVIDDTRPEPQGTTKRKTCASSKPSDLDLPAHAAPIAFSFYRGSQFPAAYRGDGFTVLRGSWNREVPREPKVVRIRFRDGKPAAIEDFVTGFVLPDGKTHNGRLAGLAVARDGALLFSDDQNGVVYRVVYGSAPSAMTSTSTSPAAEPKGEQALARAFKTENFRAPESVLHDPEQDVYFVSNIDGEPLQKDGKGFIAKLAPAGHVVSMRFIEGLHAPKGMALRGRELWVSDIDVMRAFDRTTGAPIATIDLKPHGAVFLNDVALGGDGNIYVTDMAVTMDANGGKQRTKTDRIFRIDANRNADIAYAGEMLRAPNGIVWAGNEFIVAQNYGKDLLRWTPGSEPRVFGRGKGEWDGVVALPDGTLLASSHHDHAIHVIRNGTIEPLFARRPAPADIGYDGKRHLLLIPSLEGDWVEAWHLPQMQPAQRSSVAMR
jgi:glucose/arabinose dehydrogenase